MPAERRLPHTAWLAVPPGCAAEHGVEISDLGQAAAASQNPPGSARAGGSPAATDVSDAADVAADPPIPEADLQKAWRLVDWNVAFFLCISPVQFGLRRNIVAGVSACCAIAGVAAHLWWRRQQHALGGNSAEALNAAMLGLNDVVSLFGFLESSAGLFGSGSMCAHVLPAACCLLPAASRQLLQLLPRSSSPASAASCLCCCSPYCRRLRGRAGGTHGMPAHGCVAGVTATAVGNSPLAPCSP